VGFRHRDRFSCLMSVFKSVIAIALMRACGELIRIKFKLRQAEPIAHLAHGVGGVLREVFKRHILNALMNGGIADILDIFDKLQRPADNAAIAK